MNAMKWLVIVLALPLAAGCNNSGSGGAGGIGGSGITLGQLLPGQASKYGETVDKSLAAAAVDESDEDELGRSVVIAATSRWPLLENEALTKYVTLVGLTVASASANPDGNWVFGVLDTPEVGAYSGPNGYVLVTRGALKLMQDEAELAGVLAHEIGHCVNHDGLNSVRNAKAADAVASAASASIKDPRAAAFARSSDYLSKVVLNIGWNQGQETTADSTGVQLLIASGYDPGGMVRFLQRVQQRQGGGGRLFGTHPGTADRVGRITSQAGPAKGDGTHAARFAKAKGAANL